LRTAKERRGKIPYFEDRREERREEWTGLRERWWVLSSVLNLDTPWPKTVRNGTNTAENETG
jgi:hypothetical protein